MNYCTSLFTIPEKKCNNTAFVEPETATTVTYRELQNQVRSFAQHLQNQGVQAGDTVVIHLYNSIAAAVVHMAAQYMGAVSCLIDPLTQTKSLPYYTNETEAKMLVTHCQSVTLPDEIVTAMKITTADELECSFSIQSEEIINLYEWQDDDICYIYYTSGTTSAPKGVTLTVANHENFFKITEKYWQPVSEQSKHICFVPLSHGFGSIFLLPLTIRTRAELYIMRSFHPGKVADAIETYGITHIYGVPSHYQQLLRFKNFHPALQKLQMAFCAAAKLEHATMQQWKEVTGFYLDEGYGLIETTGGVVWRVGDEPQSTGHVGECPDPSLIEIGILDPNGTPLTIGEEGEIAVRGDSVMPGYLKKPEENTRVFVDGWFKTGDKGYISSDNQLFMTGRIKDIINIAGIKISPYEVEAVLNNNPQVAQSIVVACEDALYGEVVKAYIQLNADANISERELIKYASLHLINFQVPKVIEFVSTFPTNNIGKIDRKALRTM